MTPEEYQAIMNLVAGYQIAVAFAIIFAIALTAVGVAWLVYEKWFTPLESKELRKTFRKKRPLVVLGGDDGYADFKDGFYSGPEGIIETKPQGRTEDHFTGALARPHIYTEHDLSEAGMTEATKENPTEQEKAKVQKTLAVANYLSAIANRRLLLRGSRIPVWFAYRGKAILTSLYWIVTVQILDGMAQAKEFKDAFATIDLVAIKSLFPFRNWNQSQINAQETDKERKGELKAKRFAGKESLILLFAIMIVLVVVVIVLVAVAYYFSH